MHKEFLNEKELLQVEAAERDRDTHQKIVDASRAQIARLAERARNRKRRQERQA